MCAQLLKSAARASAAAGSTGPPERVLRRPARASTRARSRGCCAIAARPWCSRSPPWPQRLPASSLVPKGFFPQQDTGRIIGSIQAEQDISFPAMRTKLADFARPGAGRPGGDQRGGLHRRRRQHDQQRPDVHHAQAAPRADGVGRRRSSRACAASSRQVPGATLFLQAGAGRAHRRARMSNAQYQYTLQSPNLDELNALAPQMLGRLRDAARAARRGHRPAEPRPAGGGRHRSRRRLAPGRRAPRPSTTRSTTPSASARSRPSSPSATSTAWCWRSPPTSSRAPTRSRGVYVRSPTRRAGAAERLHPLRARHARRCRSTTRASSRR